MKLTDGKLRKKLNNAFAGKLDPVTIRRELITGNANAAGVFPTEVASYSGEGCQSQWTDYYRANNGIPANDVRITILGMSIEPDLTSIEKDDKILLKGKWYQVRAANTDIIQATWDCQCFAVKTP